MGDCGKEKERIKSGLDFVGARDEERATTGRPYKIRVRSVRKIRVRSMHRDDM